MKKNLIITTVLVILIIALSISIFIWHRQKNSDNVSKINDVIVESEYKFKLIDTTTKGTDVNGYVYNSDCYFYKNDNIAIFLYDYDDEASAKEALLDIKEERKNESNELEYLEHKTHTELNICVENSCIKNIAFDNYLVSLHYTNDKEYIYQTEEIIKKMLQA